jgi:MFS family permease
MPTPTPSAVAETPYRLADLPPSFRWLLAGAFVAALATFVFPFLALFLTARGFEIAEAGLTAGSFGLGAAVSGPICGALADRIGRRPTLVGALLLSSAVTAALPWLDSPAAVIAGTLALGVVANGYRPVAAAIIADVVPPAGRARAYGLLYWAQNVGVGVSFVVGGALAAHGYRLLFLLDAATTALFALVVLAMVPETRPAAAVRAARDGGPGFAAAARDGVFLGLVGLAALVILPFSQFMVAVPLVMAEAGLGPEVFGRVMAVNCLVIALVQPFAGRVTAGWDPSRVLALAAALVGLGYGGYALAGSAWGWAAATAVWSLGETITFPTVEALVAALSPAALRGRYQGLVGVAYGIGFALSPPLGAVVLERHGARVLWLGCLAAGATVAALHLAAGPARRRARLGASGPTPAPSPPAPPRRDPGSGPPRGPG